MKTALQRRWVGAATLTAALLLASVPTLAAATAQASVAGTIGPYLHGIAISPGQDSNAGSIGFQVSDPGVIEIDNLAVTVDTSKLPAGATLSLPDYNQIDWQCTTSTGSVACSAIGPVTVSHSFGGLFTYADVHIAFDVTAASGAAYGVGSLTVSATATGLTGLSASVPVGIAQPVELAAGSFTSFTGPPGSTYSTQPSVTNAGTATVHSVRLYLASDLGFDLTNRYTNCLYYAPNGAVCTFDNDLLPGVTYRVSEPVTVQIAPDHVAPFLGATEIDWNTPLDLSTQFGSTGTPGTDGPLNLVVQSTDASAPPLTQPGLPQTDHNGLNGTHVDVSVSGVNPADLAAVGASVQMSQWGMVNLSLGVTNRGPAVGSMNRSGDPLTDITVTLPSGATATKVSFNCAPYVSGQPDWTRLGAPGFGQYDCPVYQNLSVGQAYLLPFTLQVWPVTQPYQGSVTVLDAANPAGNSASFVITPVQPPGRVHVGTSRATD